MKSKALTSEEKKIANDFIKAYEKCTSYCETVIKQCEDTTKYLFVLETQTKKNKPFKIFRKSYNKWKKLMNLIEQQKSLNDQRYMDTLKELEELIDIRLNLKEN